jgi:uncharacterized cupredoxin-like copper-binding protein
VRALGLAALLAVSAAVGCGPRTSHSSYAPRVREVTLTAVPLLTKEMQSIYPFLREDFAPHGVLEGKEIYAFVPGTVTVYEGDTVHFTLVNPEDDEHEFVLGDLVVDLPGQTVQRATWVARRVGIFDFSCVMPSHIPYMWGQVIVLPSSVAGDFASLRPDAPPSETGASPAR